MLKCEEPQVRKVQLRSNEAGCYHKNDLIVSVQNIGKGIGIDVTGSDFSEPQYGKDICNRILCLMKSCTHRCCNEGHDVLSAHDMCTAMMQRPVCGTTACVSSFDDKSKQTLEVNKIERFSSFHSFKFEKEGVHL